MLSEGTSLFLLAGDEGSGEHQQAPQLGQGDHCRSSVEREQPCRSSTELDELELEQLCRSSVELEEVELEQPCRSSMELEQLCRS